MITMLNLEMNLIVISVLLLIYIKVVKNIDQQTKNVVFSRLLLLMLLISVAETMQIFLSGRIYYKCESVLRCVLAIKYSLSALVSCYWCHYLMCESLWLRKNLFKSRLHIVLVFPAMVLIAMSILSYWTDWIYSITGSCFASYGKYHVFQTVITYAYFTLASVTVLISIMKPENRNHLFTQIMLIVLPFILGLIHLFEPRLVVVWPGLTVILLKKFTDFQEEQIFIDSLTGLNNRRSFDKYLSLINSEKNPFAKKFFLYMIDLDYFKKINDTFGHTEGDAALIRTGEILKSVCAGRNAFLSRFGGDEFAIVYIASSDESARAFNEDLKEAFRQYNIVSMKEKRYPLNISVGYTAVPKKAGVSCVQIINSADSALYEAKHSGAELPVQHKLAIATVS